MSRKSIGSEGQRLDSQVLEAILDLSRRLDRPFQLEDMLKLVVEEARTLLRAERGSLFLYESVANEFVSKVATGAETLRFPADKGILGAAASTRQVVNVPDCYGDRRFNRDADRKTGFHTRCLLAIPLIGHEESLVGVLQLLNKTDGVFDAHDEKVASVFAAQCAVALQRAQLTEQLMIRECMNRELSIARDIQMSMISTDFEQVRSRSSCELAAALEPARQVGGDFYDFFFVDEHLLCVCVGDVCGKGVPAGLFMALSKTLIEYRAENDVATAGVITDVNDRLARRNPQSMFVTLFIAIIDVRTGRTTYTNAGHNPPYIRRADGSPERLDQRHGPIVGAMEGSRYGQAHAALSEGDTLVLYTDGVTEAIDPDGELFSEARFAELIGELDGDPDALVQAVVRAVRDFERGADPTDDVTVLALRFRPAAVEP